jgi:hypothetical protein
VSDQIKPPVYALCGSGYWFNSRLPWRGRAVAEDWNPDPAAEGGIRGLAWGKGDPAAAFLDHGNWAVVRVDDPAEPVQIPGAVKFREGTVVYNGSRRGALETLILCGADPAAMTVRLVTPGLNGIAEAAHGGVAVSGYAGLARAGDGGEAFAGRQGLAVAGSNGTASVGDEFGIAFSGSRGTAVVGYEGIAVVRSGEATAGELGVAVALGRGGTVMAGEGGHAVALGSVPSIRIGVRGIAVGLDVVEGRACIQAASNALVVLRIRDGEAYRFVVAVAGEEGFSADTPLSRWGGEWCHPHDVPKAAASAPAPARQEPAAEDDPSWTSGSGRLIGPPIDMDLTDFRRELGEDVLVLCALPRDERDKPCGETIHAPDWDPAPESRTGYFGLLWGEGDADVGGLERSNQWWIMRVAAVQPVLSGGVQVAVRFESGKIWYVGSPSMVLDELLVRGANRAQLSGRLVEAGDRDIAEVGDSAVAVAGRGGWALAGIYAEAFAGSDGIASAGGESRAEVGPDGIAITGAGGYSEAGARGVAISLGKRYGEARAGDRGVAIGHGRYKILRAGRGGAAIGMDHSAQVAAGDGGVAIGDHAHAGRNGVAIAPGGTVSGGRGCLLVQHWWDGERIRYATGIAGEGGILPDVDYGVHEGKLCRKEDIPKPASEPGFLPDFGDATD